MSPNFVSTQYLANSLVLPVQLAQGQLTTAMTELSTGQYADLGLQLGDQSGYELSLKEQVQQLQALTTGNSVVATTMSTAQAALTSIATSAETTMKDLVGWTAGSTGAGTQLQLTGQTGLQGLIASANATSGDVYVFGGINSSVAPLPDDFSSTVTAAVQLAFNAAFPDPANADASQANTFLASVAALFTDSNWTTTPGWSQASGTNTTAVIAPGQQVTTSTSVSPNVTTADPNPPPTAFQQLTQAYALLAVGGGSGLSSTAQQAVVTAAEPLISQGQASLTNAQATLGATQAQVTVANSGMSSQLTLIQTQIGNLDNVDPAATASKITALTNQIQMAYELTSRLQNLTLAQYLPA